MQRSNTGEIIEIPQAPSGGCCYDHDEATIFEDAKHRVASKNKLLVAIAICTVFMLGQVVAGIKENSLAIQTDAAHMLSDILSFAISFFSLWASSWKATPRYTYGFFRIEILGALVSVLITWIVTGILCYKAVDRIIHGTEGHDVQGWIMVLIGSLEDTPLMSAYNQLIYT
ncbi:metal tolerance protein 1-like [Papaver somniferum]|uniref:metal tolerance protein 1-like n=1 Tax=Papaver somniferum TaxID=3469 RepID=UPI000E6FBD70|nr:metal tolerance protein 1-like [Papaver somniferum]